VRLAIIAATLEALEALHPLREALLSRTRRGVEEESRRRTSGHTSTQYTAELAALARSFFADRGPSDALRDQVLLERLELGKGHSAAIIAHWVRQFASSPQFRSYLERAPQNKTSSGDPLEDSLFDTMTFPEELVESPPHLLVVEVLTGAHRGLKHEIIGQGSVSIGRRKSRSKAASEQIVLSQDPTVSRKHALIELAPPHCILRNQSTRGSQLNHRRVISEARLADGDIVALGKTRLRIGLPEDSGKATERLVCCTACGVVVGPALSGADQRCARCTGDLLASQPIPGVELLTELGSGAMGSVFLARELTSNRLVALKTLTPSRELTPRRTSDFLRDARLSASFRHPNAVQIFHCGFAAGRFYITMEYNDGHDLGRFVADEGALQPELALTILRQVSRALESAHAAGLIHGAVKPSNILIRRRPNGALRAKLCDLGLRRAYLRIGSGVGEGAEDQAAQFLAPEQREGDGKISFAADIYSLGATLTAMLGGSPPAIEAEAEPGLSDSFATTLPATLVEFLDKCLHREPERRFASMAELRRALKRSLAALKD